MAATTQRRTGQFGKAVINPGTTPTWDGADITDWSVKLSARTEDASAKGDAWEVDQVHRKSWTASCKKLVSTPTIGTIDIGSVVTVEFYNGADPDTPETTPTAEIISGTAIVTSFGYQSPDGMETEDIEFKGSGAPTIT